MGNVSSIIYRLRSSRDAVIWQLTEWAEIGVQTEFGRVNENPDRAGGLIALLLARGLETCDARIGADSSLSPPWRRRPRRRAADLGTHLDRNATADADDLGGFAG